jgi:putative addiction module CopG family antidote
MLDARYWMLGVESLPQTSLALVERPLQYGMPPMPTGIIWLSQKSLEFPMPTITTDSLPADVSAYIQAELGTGKYHSAEELVATALREQRDRQQHLAELNAKLEEGLQDVAAGRVIEIRSEQDEEAFFDSIKRRGRERLEQRRQG